MVNSAAPALLLRGVDRDELMSWARSTGDAGWPCTAGWIVLLAADGTANSRIAAEVGHDDDLGVEVAWPGMKSPGCRV